MSNCQDRLKQHYDRPSTRSFYEQYDCPGSPSYKRVDRRGVGLNKHVEQCVSKDSLPPELKQLMGSRHCRLCQVKSSSNIDAEMHYRGKYHATQVNCFMERYCREKGQRWEGLALHTPTISYTSSFPYYCEVCNVKAISEEQLRPHLIGKRHQANLEKQKMGESDVSSKNLKGCDLRIDEQTSIACKYCPYIGHVHDHECDRSLAKRFEEEKHLESKIVCYPCSVVFNNEGEFETHQTSRRHVLLAHNRQENQVVEQLKFWYCMVCKKQYRNNQEYTEHLFGEAHSAANQDFVPDVKRNFFQCRVCDLILDYGIKDEHEKDKRHIEQGIKNEIKESLKKLAHAGFGKHSFCCTNCKVTVHGLIKYKEHLLSARHIYKIADRFLNKDLILCSVCGMILDAGNKVEHENDIRHIENGLKKEVQESV